MRPAPGEKLTVRPNPGFERGRTFLRLCGSTYPLRFGVHENSLANVMRGLRERVFAVEDKGILVPTPKPEEGAFKCLEPFGRQLCRVIGTLSPWDYEQFVESYTGAKRVRMQEAVESVLVNRCTKRDALLRTFVKAEKLNLTKKPDPAPRVIQPRDARYNVEVGRYLKPAEHRIYEGIASIFGGPTVMKGYNAQEQGEMLQQMWGEFHSPCAVDLDASRFDQHVSADALRWEHSIYNSLYRDRELAKLLKWQIHNKGIAYTAEGRVTYQVEGCRMSGDMNTALGNCLLMCALVYTYAKERGIRIRLANNGDDCVVFMNAQDRNMIVGGLKEWFLARGFNMKVGDIVYDLEKVEFCQTRPVFIDGAYRMVRSPAVAMSKDVVNLHPGEGRISDYLAWLDCVACCGESMSAGVPILQQFYQTLKGIPGKRGKVVEYQKSGMRYLARGMHGRTTSISEESRYRMWLSYGFTPDEQIVIENKLSLFKFDHTLSPMNAIGEVEALIPINLHT